MTLDFRYLQYEPENFMSIGLPRIIGSISYFILYLFVFLSAKERKEESNKPIYLKIFAIIGMVSTLIPLFIPEGFYYASLTEGERLMIGAFLIFQGLIYSIPLFMAGILLFLYGFLNRSRFRKYLLAAGILWLIYYGFSIITLNGSIGNMFRYLLHLEPGMTDFQRFMYVLQASFLILLVSTFSLFIIHGAKNSDYKFIYAGLISYISISLTSLFSTIGVFYFF